MCNTRIVSRKTFIAIASVFYPVGVTKNRKRSLAIIFLMRITATQKIADHSVNFDLIYNSFTLLVFDSCIVSGKNFKAIASVVVLVGVAKNCKRFFSDICVYFFKSLRVTTA